MASTADIDELLSRIRQLQKLIPQASDAHDSHPELSPRAGPSHSVRVEQEASPCIIPDEPRARPTATRATETPVIDVEETLDLLRQVTFVRVTVESLVWENTPSLLRRQFAKNVSPRERGQLLIEYQFPAATGDFQTLRKRVRLAAKTFLPTVAHFNHRRVALLKFTSPLLDLWTKTSLWFRIYHQTSDKGKHSLRQIGRCCVSLGDLLKLPFHLDKWITVECAGDHAARGRLNVSLQLGSRLPVFADRIEQLLFRKSDTSDNYKYLEPRTLPPFEIENSNQERRSPELATAERHDVQVGYRPRIDLSGRRQSTGLVMSSSPPQLDAASARSSSSASVDMGIQTWNWKSSGVQTEPEPDRTAPAAARSSTVAERLRKQSNCIPDEGYLLELTVHSACNLPLVKGPNRDALAPTVYVSYRGEDRLKMSPVVRENTDPVWNWSTKFFVSPQRKNVVLKFWHRCSVRGDRVLGFVSLALPLSRPSSSATGFYDLVDLSQCSTGRVKITLKAAASALDDEQSLLCRSFVEEIVDESCTRETQESGVNTSMHFAPTPSPIDQYVEMASRSLLVDKLKTNMQELDALMAKLPHRV